MSTPDFGALVARHRNYFLSGATRSAKWRETQLIALRSMMKDHADEFYAALWTDLRRNRTGVVPGTHTIEDHGCPHT